MIKRKGMWGGVNSMQVRKDVPKNEVLTPQGTPTIGRNSVSNRI